MDDHTTDSGARLRNQLRILREQKWLILVCLILTIGPAYYLSSIRPKAYEATAQVLLTNDDLPTEVLGIDGGNQPDPEREAATAIELVKQPAVAARVIRQLSLREDTESLLADISATTLGNSRVLTITATDGSAAGAARLANAYAREYVGFRRETERSAADRALVAVEAERRTAEAAGDARRVSDLDFRASQLELLRSTVSGGANLIQTARPPDAAVAPRPLRTAVLAAVVGLLLGVGLALLRDRLDSRLKREEQVQDLFPGVPMLASIPSWRRGGTPALQTEGIRSARATLALIDPDRSIGSLLITSPTSGDGKSATSLDLSLAMAEAEESVVLLDADLRRRGLSERLGLGDQDGVAEILLGEGEVMDYLTPVSNDDGRLGRYRPAQGRGGSSVASPPRTGALHVVPAGVTTANPATLLSPARVRRLIDTATDVAGRVVIDGTPLGVVTDMLPFTAHVDAVVIVVHLYHTRRDELSRLVRHVEQAGIAPVGLVIYGADNSDRAYSSYFDS